LAQRASTIFGGKKKRLVGKEEKGKDLVTLYLWLKRGYFESSCCMTLTKKKGKGKKKQSQESERRGVPGGREAKQGKKKKEQPAPAAGPALESLLNSCKG